MYYPHLIREFYSTMAHEGDGWTAEVRGVHILVNAEMLKRVREIPIQGMIMDYLGDRVEGSYIFLREMTFKVYS